MSSCICENNKSKFQQGTKFQLVCNAKKPTGKKIMKYLIFEVR